MWHGVLWHEPSHDDVDALKRAFLAHEARVRRTVPADRLLVHRATDGWAPLCKFLEIEACPQTPFPRQNDREVMIAMTNTWWALTWVWPRVPLLAIFFVFVLGTCGCACGGRAATPVAKAKSKSKKIA